MLEVQNLLKQRRLNAGVVTVHGVRLSDTPAELKEQLDSLVLKRSGEDFPPEDLKSAVRNLLRTAAYKPTGRGKPASEYLAQSAREGRFPFINNLVDVNNYMSLSSGLPISLLDLAVTTESVMLRDGFEGEKYVFNEAGQEIDLNGLICVCRKEGEAGIPLGTPVKDSMAAKLKAETDSVLGVIYAPASSVSGTQLVFLLEEFALMLERFGGGRTATVICE